MSKQADKVMEGAPAFLEPGEDAVAVVIARPRGWTQSVAGGPVGRGMGASKAGKQKQAGQQSGLTLASPMALAVTQRRLIVFKISAPVGRGIGGEIKEVASGVPLAQVDSITSKRLLIGRIVTVTVGGVPVKLEVNGAADVDGLIKAFEDERAKAPAG